MSRYKVVAISFGVLHVFSYLRTRKQTTTSKK